MAKSIANGVTRDAEVLGRPSRPTNEDPVRQRVLVEIDPVDLVSQKSS